MGDLNPTPLYVPIPDGMTVEDARDALNAARPWVPVSFWHEVPKGARYRNVGGIRRGDGVDGRDGTYEVHPDDAAPADPDADLIERMAEKIQNAQNEELFSELTDMWKDRVRRQARAALAVAREADQS